ncbi:PAS domain S-box protein [Flavobacterium sp. LT1R49]|uniref:PAS domain S-box protein n=1 Tax=Flavobacterium arabinosi TaxID=3398737 RepID=UPI003A8817F0
MKNLLLSISKANNHLLKQKSLEDALNFCIKEIGSGQDFDRCYIYKNEIDNGVLKFHYKYEWCNKGIEPYIDHRDPDGIAYDALPELYKTLSSDESFQGLVKDCSNELFKQIMGILGIQSYLFTPIFSDDLFWGWIGCDDCKNEKKWRDEDLYTLHTIAKNIGFQLNQDRIVSKLEITLEKINFYMEGSNQAMWEFDINTNQTVYSYNWAGLLGYTNDEIIQEEEFWKRTIHPDDLNQLLMDTGHLISNRLDNYVGTTRMIHKTGKVIWVKYDILLKKNKEGKPLKLIGTHIDVSELKEKEIQLKLSEEKFRFIADNTTDLICQYSNDGNFQYVSTSSKEITGYLPEELINKSSWDFFHKKDFRKIKNYYENTFKSLQSSIVTYRFRKKDGSYIWLEATTKAIINSENKVLGLQSSSRDISERIKRAEEVKAANAKEKELNDMKSQFVSMASHQFRTPLTVIYSNAELIDFKINHFEENKSQSIACITSRIKTEVDRMTELMNNILIFAKDESQKLKKQVKPVDFNVFIETLIDTYFNNNLYEREIKIKIKGKKKPFFTDEIMLVHILTNLISNAFKYSVDRSNPELEITYSENEIEILVIDYGIGIPEDEIKHLFTSFFRASNTSTIIGSGLGLSIVKQFVTFLKGTIELKTKEHFGTTIKLIFPYE